MAATFEVRTWAQVEFVNITDGVQAAVGVAGVLDGIACVYAPHTTAGVTINEGADPDVVRDITWGLEKMVPSTGYEHSEGNSPAHLKATLVGCSTCVPVAGGRLVLGTWQAIFFCEFDGPRSRRVVVEVVGRGGR